MCVPITHHGDTKLEGLPINQQYKQDEPFGSPLSGIYNRQSKYAMERGTTSTKLLPG